MVHDPPDASEPDRKLEQVPRRRFLQGVVAGSTLTAQTTVSRAGGDPADDTDTEARPAGDPPKIAWEETYGGTDNDWARSVIETNDGGYLFVGTTGSFGSGGLDAWLVKVDPGGAVQWEQTYGGSDNDWGYSVVESSEGGYLLAGVTTSSGSGGRDAWLVKVDARGAVEWEETYGGSSDEWASAVIETGDGGYLVAGGTGRNASGPTAWLVKVDRDGTTQWEQTYDSLDSSVNSVIETSAGGYLFAGYQEGGTIPWLVKIKSDGTIQWDSTYGDTTTSATAHSVIETSDGSYLLSGRRTGPDERDEAWVGKIGRDGKTRWETTYVSGVQAYAAIETDNGGYLIAGTASTTFSSGVGEWDAWVAKIDSTGVLQWQQAYGRSSEDWMLSVLRSSDGGYLFAGGMTATGNSEQEAWLVKLEGEGGTPEAAFSVRPDEPSTGETVTFDASDSEMTGGDGTIGEYRWDFDGDGTVDATGETVTHAYDDAGEYTVTLTVVATNGTEATAQETLTITRELPVGNPPEIAWEETYGGTDNDWARSVIETSDGGYLFVGGTESRGSGEGDAWLMKVDSSGAVQWEQTYDGSDDDQANSVVESSDGGYLFAGNVGSVRSGDTDAWLVKVDSSGAVQWEETYRRGAGDWASWAASVVETGDGGYLFAGITAHIPTAWLVKVDQDGNTQWEQTYDGLDAWVYSVIETSDGGYLFTGSLEGKVGWVVKVGRDGTKQWESSYGSYLDYKMPYSVTESSDGGYLLAGITDASGSDGFCAWLAKVDPEGTTQWEQTYGGSDDDRARSIIESSEGGYLVAGWTGSVSSGEADGWLVKVDSSGAVQWEQTYGGSESDQPSSVIESSEGGYLVAGRTKSSGSGDEDAWLAKLEGERSTPDEGSTPIAAFTVDPDEPTTGETVTFDASESSNSDGEIQRYEWDFTDDGTTDATGVEVDHTFEDAGDYAVTLTVVDSNDNEDSETTVVDVIPEAVVFSTRKQTTVHSPVTVQTPATDEGSKYLWRVEDKPEGADPGLLHGEDHDEIENDKETEFIRHAVLRPEEPGLYELTVEVLGENDETVSRGGITIDVDTDKLINYIDTDKTTNQDDFSINGAETVSELVERYSPVLHFHRKENFLPTRYEAFFENSEIHINGSSNPVLNEPSLLTLGSTRSDYSPQEADRAFLKGANKNIFQNHQENYPRTVHVSITNTRFEEDGENYIALTYWFFYIFDEKSGSMGEFISSHPSDTESITILIDEDGPQWVGAAQHFSGEYLEWEKYEQFSGLIGTPDPAHIDVFPALGSHASFLVNTAHFDSEIPFQWRWSEFLPVPDATGTVSQISEETASHSLYSYNDDSSGYDIVVLPNEENSESDEERWTNFAGKFDASIKGEWAKHGELPMQRGDRWDNPGLWIPDRMLPESKVLDADPRIPVGNFQRDDEGRVVAFEVRALRYDSWKSPSVKPHTFYFNQRVREKDALLFADEEYKIRTREPAYPFGWNEQKLIFVQLDDLSLTEDRWVEVTVEGQTYQSDVGDTLSGFPLSNTERVRTDESGLIAIGDLFSLAANSPLNNAVPFASSPSSDPVSPGDVVEADVTVENTGSVDHRFFVKLFARASDDRVFDNDGTAGQAVTLEEGEKRTLTLSWTVEQDAPEDTYDLVTEIWRESDPEELLNLYDRDVASDAISIEKSTGELNVTAEPEAAMINVGQEFIGETPIEGEALPIGSYEVVAFHENHLPIQKTVVVEEGETTTVEIDLADPDPPVFEIDQIDKPSQVNEQEEFGVSALIKNAGDEAGTQDIEYHFDGRVEASRTVELDGNESELVQFTRTAPEDPGEYEHSVSSEDDSETGVIVVGSAFDVEWQSPVDGGDHIHDVDQTLPIKFELHDRDEGLIEDAQAVYLSVYGPSTDSDRGAAVERWFRGEGEDALRFDPDHGEYIADFHTREYELEGGTPYTAVVHDAGTNDEIDAITFETKERGQGNTLDASDVDIPDWVPLGGGAGLLGLGGGYAAYRYTNRGSQAPDGDDDRQPSQEDGSDGEV